MNGAPLAQEAAAKNGQKPSDVSAQIVISGDFGLVPEAKVVHVRNAAQLADLLKSLGLDALAVAEREAKDAKTMETDWATSQLVFVRSENKPSGGFKFEVVEFESGPLTPVLRLKLVPPGPDDMVTMAVTTPWVVVRTSRTEKDVAVSLEEVSPRSNESKNGDALHQDH
jgi:hypothetical protein